MEELKPCPFCGGEAVLYTTVENCYLPIGKVWVYCKTCRSTSQSFKDTSHDGLFITKAIEAWNRRATE